MPWMRMGRMHSVAFFLKKKMLHIEKKKLVMGEVHRKKTIVWSTMVFVYLMGIADILAAVMLLTGARPEFMLKFAVAMLIYTAIFSFVRPSFFIAFSALGNLTVSGILLNAISIGNIAPYIVVFQLFKGYLSFWELNFVRNFTIGAVYVSGKLLYAIFRKSGNFELSKLKFVLTRTFYFGKNEINSNGTISNSNQNNATKNEKNLAFSAIIKNII